VQVLGSKGEVLAESSDIQASGPLVELRPAPGEILHVDQPLPFDDDPYRVIARGGTSNGHTFTVFVGQSLGPVEYSVQVLLTLLVIGVPLLLVILGAATFVFARRSLRPVEAIRRTVASINNRDLSERVAVPIADDAVSRLAKTMNAMLERLEVAQRAQRQFVADASHELRSPIATLATTAEINLAHPESGDSRDFSVVVLEESRRLQRLVDNLLMLARADERGMRPSSMQDVDLDDIVSAERRRITATSELIVEASIQPARATGDPHQLRQLVRNLADNAVQHARSRIELSVYRRGQQVIVEVFNDGPVIEPGDRERIFDRFVRLEESRARASGGTGLGLAIVREIVTAHQGIVRVIDDPGGARFQLTLPAATD
jgi:signal transduction histidine kinase